MYVDSILYQFIISEVNVGTKSAQSGVVINNLKINDIKQQVLIYGANCTVVGDVPKPQHFLSLLLLTGEGVLAYLLIINPHAVDASFERSLVECSWWEILRLSRSTS